MIRREKAPHRGTSCYRPVGEPGPAGARVEPLGEGLMLVLPHGLRPLFRAAAALPASFDMPLFRFPAAEPVVPLAAPEVVPLAAVPPVGELPPVELPLCASAQVAVSPSAVANASVASLMIAPWLVA